MIRSCISTLTGLCLAAGCSLTANAQITEPFNDITTLPGAGWTLTNQSVPVGTTNWFQGNPLAFPSHAGNPDDYIAANFNNTTGTNTISNWLITPSQTLQNGKQLRFWTRCPTDSTFPDRLEVRQALTAAGGLPVGPASVGDFTTLLLTINPTLIQGGYPDVWTEFVINLSGIGAPTSGRLAFRYFVTGGGPTGANSDYIGIDTMSFGDPPNPCAQPLPFCPADIAPAGGDDLVNVQDLLAVIGSWGDVQSPPGTGPRPEGDTAPLPNGDCLVNTQDLLAVIAAWGNCPIPTGRCCAVNGTCSIQTAANCATAGGNYGGDGTTCVAFTCPVLPPNDNCAGAIIVTNGQTNMDNTTATTSGGIPGGDCILGGGDIIASDLWFSYTATCTGRLSVDMCATGGLVSDTTLQLFTGTCGALTEVACDDDACGDTENLLSAITDFDVTSGQQFFIRVGSWNGTPPGGVGPMVMTIGCTIPSDDFCQDATPLGALPATIVGNLSTATADGNTCGAVAAGIGRWYTVSSITQRNLTASICDSPLGLWDGAISVFCGNDCNGLVCVAADAGDVCGFNPNPVTWCAAAGQTYWILVHAVGGDFSAGGAFELDVTAGVACGSSVTCGATNDECSGATVVNLGANAGDNSLATTSAGIPGGACTFAGVSNFTRDVWFTHTPAATGTLTIDTCASTGPVTDTVLSVFTGACGALTEIGCIDDGCGPGGLLGSVGVPVTSGVPIKIRVGSWNTSPAGTFTLTLTVPPPACVLTCPGGSAAEGEPCLTAPPDSINGGCNSTPTVYGVITANGPAICGIGSTYLNGTIQTRDTDWYRFTVAVAGTYRIGIRAEFTALVGFATNISTPGSPCVGAAFVAGSTLVLTPAQAAACNTEVTSPAVNLAPGNYAVFVGTSVFTGFPCGGANDYAVRLITP